jgi:predicted molibdopterin-dependent oxidoreductase YjgC
MRQVSQTDAQGFVIVDGNELSFEPGDNLVQAAARAGIEIPTLCWDPRLTPAGACRLCLVEIDGSPRLAPACATRCAPGMVVRTDTPEVARNRRFILSIHAADVAPEALGRDDPAPSRLPDLIDRYGTAGAWPATLSPRAERPNDDNRFIEFRADRCISCSQCTRYCDEIEAVSAITMAGRGAATTVATADAKGLLDTTCELCGGCVAVCPTGAMADRPSLEHGKPERDLEAVRTTCNFCGVGCQLDLWVDRAANRVVKATPPAPGTTVNDGSLCVKGRFANDFVHHQDRLTTPLVRHPESGELVPATWEEALERAVAGLKGVAERHGLDALGFVSSSRCTVEENYLVQKMARAAFGTHNVHQCAAT